MKPTKDIQDYGDTIYYTDLGDPTVSDYTGTVTHEDLKDSLVALLIDKQKLTAFKIQDVDKAMASVDLEGSQNSRAAYRILDTIERDVFQNVVSFANAGTVTDATCDTATILGDLASLSQYLQENNVSETNMWCVVPPWVKIKLMLAGIKFQINNGINGKGTMPYTKDLGFDLYVTNTVYNSNTVAAPVSSILAGSYQSIAFAKKVLPSRSFELQTTRAVGVDNLTIYGYKVIKPKELALATLTYAAETAI